jgi:hypothetical protein
VAAFAEETNAPAPTRQAKAASEMLLMLGMVSPSLEFLCRT